MKISQLDGHLRVRRFGWSALLFMSVSLLSLLLGLLLFQQTSHADPTVNDTARWVNNTTIRLGDSNFTRTVNGTDSRWIFRYTSNSGGVSCNSTLTFHVDPYGAGGGQSAYRKLNLNQGGMCLTVSQDTGQNGTRISVSNSSAVNGDTDDQAGSGGTAEEEEEAGTACEGLKSPLAWIICPVVNGLLTFTENLDFWITDLMTVDTGSLFNPNNESSNRNTSKAYYGAWSSFRTIALGLVVIVALIIIIASAFGFEVLDAYAIRKALPRVALAVILIALSWDILEFLVTLSNDVGNGIRALIYAPFSGLEQNQVRAGEQGVLALLLAGGFFFMGIWGILSFALTAALAVLVAFLVLILREMIIVLLVIVSPIAFALLILPNTQKYWQFWQNTLTAMLIAFPLIAAFIATGRVFSTVAYQNGEATTLDSLIAFIAYFLPYFLLPLTFRMAGGLLASLGNVANNSERGAFDRLKKFRARKTSENIADAKVGNRFKGNGMIAKGLNRTTAGVANAPNAGLTPWKMRSRLQGAASTRRQQELAEYMDKNADWKGIAGNDDYLQATMKNMGGGDNESDWRRYLEKQGYQGQALEQGVAQIRAAKRGASNEVFQQAAVMANASTGTGWKEGGPAQMLESINEVAGNDRHMANNMLAQMRGAAVQAGRLDLGGAGFGKTAGMMEGMHRGAVDTKTANRELIDNILEVKGPGDFVRARGQAIENIAPHMKDRLVRAHQSVQTAHASGDAEKIRNAERSLGQEYAALDNLHDSLNHSAPENAKLLADTVLGQKVAGDVTVMQNIQRYQQGGTDPGSRAFLETKRTYGAAQYAAEQGRPPEPE